MIYFGVFRVPGILKLNEFNFTFLLTQEPNWSIPYPKEDSNSFPNKIIYILSGYLTE